MASVRVAVRVRPFNQREIDLDAQLIIKMRGKTTGILNCKANTRDESIRYKEFTFDHSYWSHDQSNDFASQERVYNDLGTEVVDCAFEGYNGCVFAYGQTGSGKTFTMMGSPENQGLIPRICKALFERMAENSKRGTTHRVQVSYLEIYQERVADLLRERDASSLKVREHPKKGPYVEGLTTCLVTNYGHIQECMNRGNSHRTTAATNMNDVSSRSHAIFTITFVQAGYCDGVPSETVSKIHLVDLAGSERADATGATGQRLKEGAHINKSLVTLGSVISSLAELSASDASNQRKSFFIPYRDSVLTWLLKDSLGGNSKTIMIAAISPADCNYGETLSTLRYANRAKNIINKPTVNEDPNVKLIRELRNEISKLKALMFNEQRTDMLAQLHEKEAREKELTEEWAEKWREAQAILREQRALGLRKSGPGVVLDSDMPHLVAIDDDPLSTGVTLYHLREGETTIGTDEADDKQDIELKGAGLEPKHCTILLENGAATIVPHQGANVMLNNQIIDAPSRLSQGCIIFIGKAHVFRFNNPAEAAELRKGEKAHNLSRLSILSWSTPDLALSIENLQTHDDDKEFESKKQMFEKEREIFEKEQEEFEKKRKSLEEAQAKLEAEKAVMQQEHAQQTRQLQEDWRHLSMQQRERETLLKQRESDLICKREQLEEERRKLCDEMSRELDLLQEFKCHFVLKLNNACQFIASHANDCTFPNPERKNTFQHLYEQSKHSPLSEAESDIMIEVLNTIKGPSLLQDLVNQHRKELAELQEELNRRVDALSERRKTVEMLDKKLVDLVEEECSLKMNVTPNYFDNLKQTLASRSREELESIEKRKQNLKLNLKKINSFESPDSCKTNYTSSLERNSPNNTFSSDTYHTAVCSPQISTSNLEYLMSDSGVELKPSPRIHDESDLSSTEDYKAIVSDSQSTSSVENRAPVNRTKKRRESEAVRRLAQRILQQKQLIVRHLDLGCSKTQLDSQIATLQSLQRQYMSMKFGSTNNILLPADHHPLEDVDSESPSPIRPLHSGSTSNLYTNSPQINSRLAHSFHRSMPSIATETENDSIVTISGYCIRGAGTKTHYEYEIKICTCDDRWTILRRYSRFRDLHLAMKARYGEKIGAIPFPSKQFFANSETVAKSRKKQLEFYLNRLIETCRNHPSCPLAYAGPVTKAALVTFSPFFRKGIFENGKHGTS